MSNDLGPYHADPERYRRLLEELYEKFPPLTLPPEYNAMAQDNLLGLLFRLARYKFVARMLRPTDRVLEVGSGSGLGAIFLGQHCAQVTGLEVKSSEVAEARSYNRRENVEFVEQDLFDLDGSRKWDVVAALDVIEHMPPQTGDRLVQAMARCLRPDGMLVLGTPSAYSYEYQGPLSKASHVKCYDQEELRALVDRHFGRSLCFSMNDEVVHTGFAKLAWYYFVLAFLPR